MDATAAAGLRAADNECRDAETLPCDTPGVLSRNSDSHTAPQNPPQGPANSVGDLGSPYGVTMARRIEQPRFGVFLPFSLKDSAAFQAGVDPLHMHNPMTAYAPRIV